jgi:hypothetical protein
MMGCDLKKTLDGLLLDLVFPLLHDGPDELNTISAGIFFF